MNPSAVQDPDALTSAEKEQIRRLAEATLERFDLTRPEVQRLCRKYSGRVVFTGRVLKR